MTRQLVQVPFHGDVIDAVADDNGSVWVPLKRPCEALGLDPEGQRQRLKRQAWSVTCKMQAAGFDGKSYEMFMLHLDCVPMWLATVTAKQVDKAVLPKLTLYQKEAARVLADHFLGRRAESPQAPAGDVVLMQIQAMLAIRQDQLAMQAKQSALEVRVEGVAERAECAVALAEAAARTGESNYGYFSVLAYANRIKRLLPVAEASAHGKKLTGICRAAGIPVHRTSDPRFGYVNLYPESVLETYFAEH